MAEKAKQNKNQLLAEVKEAEELEKRVIEDERQRAAEQMGADSF